MRVRLPARVVDRHVGGNTTYARRLEEGLLARGVEVGRISAGASAPATLVRETLAGLHARQADEVLHYVADTGPLLPTRTPSVLTVHGVASRWIDTARTPRQELVWRSRVRRAIASTDHVVTVSESSAVDVRDVFGVAEDRLTVIPHGIDVARFATPTALSPELAARVPERFALYLGNVEPRKNLVALVGAFGTPRLRARELPLLVVGRRAWNEAETMAAIAGSDTVTHVDFVSDADRAALMQRCTLFVFPSLYEGFGFPVLEALAAGALVASSREGSLAEVAGPAWPLCELHAEGLAEGIEAALDDAVWQRRCLAQGREWAARHDWATSIERHLAVYAHVLHADRGRVLA